MARIMARADGLKMLCFDPDPSLPMYSDWLDALLVRGMARLVDGKDRRTGAPIKEIKPYDKHMEQPAILDEAGNVGIICVGCGKPMFGQVWEGQTISRRKLVGKGNASHMLTVSRSVKLDMIRIGGFIQMPFERRAAGDDYEFIRSWRMVPMFKRGLGCQSCRAEYEQQVLDASRCDKANKVYSDFVYTAAAKVTQERIAPALVQLDGKTANVSANRCLHGMVKAYCAICLRGKPAVAIVETKVSPFKETVPYIDVLTKDALDAGQELNDAN